MYTSLFSEEFPQDTKDEQAYKAAVNHNSLKVVTGCRVEPSVSGSAATTRFQFERQGYFCVDPDSCDTTLVFNRTVALRDSWAKIEKKGE